MKGLGWMMELKRRGIRTVKHVVDVEAIWVSLQLAALTTAVLLFAGLPLAYWLAVTRWREDPTRDCWGTFCYLRDVDSGAMWSTAWHPTLKSTKSYEAIFTQARAEFRRRDDDPGGPVGSDIGFFEPADSSEERQDAHPDRMRATRRGKSRLVYVIGQEERNDLPSDRGRCEGVRVAECPNRGRACPVGGAAVVSRAGLAQYF